jgi:hypothetical protein
MGVGVEGLLMPLMPSRGAAADRRAETGRARALRWRVVRPPNAAAAVFFAAIGAGALGGCAGSDGIGTLLVDPARYAGYRCKDLVGEWTSLTAQEKQLRELINKADDGGAAGTVIGAVAYRSDYETVLERQKVLQRTAAQKNCALKPDYSSDRTIR